MPSHSSRRCHQPFGFGGGGGLVEAELVAPFCETTFVEVSEPFVSPTRFVLPIKFVPPPTRFVPPPTRFVPPPIVLVPPPISFVPPPSSVPLVEPAPPPGLPPELVSVPPSPPVPLRLYTVPLPPGPPPPPPPGGNRPVPVEPARRPEGTL